MPQHLDIGETLATLMRAVTSGDEQALATVGASVPPLELMGIVAAQMPTALRAMPYDPAMSPILRALRAVAIARHTPSREDMAIQLHEVACEFAAADELEWAEAAAFYWADTLGYTSVDIEESATLGILLLENAPRLAAASPLIVAVVAVSATLANLPEAARLWHEALAVPLGSSSSDRYWRVRIMWAECQLISCLGDHARAQHVLRQARDHFSGRTDGDAADQAHLAGLNLAVSRFLAGTSADALPELVRDTRAFQPGGVHQAFLDVAQALLLADCGRSQEAESVLERCTPMIAVNNFDVQLAGIGPARLLCAGSRGDAATVQTTIAGLLRLETRLNRRCADARALWRIAAARALERLGNGQAARTMLDDAVALTMGAPHLYTRAWALLRRASLTSGSASIEDAREAIEIARSVPTHELLVDREPGRAVAALLVTIEAGAVDPDVFVRQVLVQIGQRSVRDSARRFGIEQMMSSGKVRHLFDELGWGASTDPLGIAAPLPALRIRLFGEFFLLRGTDDITATASWRGRRKARLLMARLLVERGRSIRRDELTDDLLPELEPVKARSSLHPLVHTLRRAVQFELPGGETPCRVTTENGRYAIVLTDDVECDLHDFLDAAELCQTHACDETAIAHGWRAVHSYGGDFLDGEELAEWIVDARERYRERWQAVVLRLAALLERRGALAEAAVPLQQLAEDDPGSEEACRMLMRIHAARGELGLVSSAFHRTSQHLTEELGLQPSRDTSTLYGSLIQ